MPSATFAERKELYRVIRNLSIDNADKVLSYAAFLSHIQQQEALTEKPNAETLNACMELSEGRGTVYSSAEAMYKDLGI